MQPEWLDKIKFFPKDAAQVESFKVEDGPNYYTHVYSYNKVMSEHDLRAICKALN